MFEVLFWIAITLIVIMLVCYEIRDNKKRNQIVKMEHELTYRQISFNNYKEVVTNSLNVSGKRIANLEMELDHKQKELNAYMEKTRLAVEFHKMHMDQFDRANAKRRENQRKRREQKLAERYPLKDAKVGDKVEVMFARDWNQFKKDDNFVCEVIYRTSVMVVVHCVDINIYFNTDGKARYNDIVIFATARIITKDVINEG